MLKLGDSDQALVACMTSKCLVEPKELSDQWKLRDCTGERLGMGITTGQSEGEESAAVQDYMSGDKTRRRPAESSH